MRKIRVKYFGPIQEGLAENGFLDIDKVTLFIGNQATGKSSVAKLFSTISWLEKSLFKNELTKKDITRQKRFIKKHCTYQGIENYFQAETEIEYIGPYYHFLYRNEELEVKEVNQEEEYLLPKIMYVPAERNFLSVVEHPEKVKYLPLPLYTFLDEFERSKSELKERIELPIDNVQFEYQKQHKIAYIKGENFRLRLHEASSGIQSLLPVYLVSRNLAHAIRKEKVSNVKAISIEQERHLLQEVDKILSNPTHSEELRELLLERLSQRHKHKCFINIVEEIEQNLFPTSQRDLLNALLELNNLNAANQLLMTTHSPYILNYLSLAIKARQLQQYELNGAKERLEKVVPLAAQVAAKQVRIYQFTQGEIRLLPTYEGIPSDDNYLNQLLSETNALFDALLEIEEDFL